MAPVQKACLSIVRFSSQDPVHRVENIILAKNKKWLSNKSDRSGRIEVEIHLSKAIKIAFINIGNAGSAFIELKVGSSMWPDGSDFLIFLPSTSLTTPQDSKTGKNKESLKMLAKDSFCKSVADQEWDRIRVICRQPFSKEQFGLQFIDLIPDDKLSKNENRATTSPRRSLEQFRSLLSPSRNRPDFSSPRRPSRAAGLVEAAVRGRGTSKAKNTKSLSPIVQRRSINNLKRASSSSNYSVTADSQRKKTVSRCSAGDIQDEVECFLEAFDFNNLPLETLTYGELKEKMEQQRGCPLSKTEKKIFLKMAEKAVEEVLDRREQTKTKGHEKQNNSSKNFEVMDLSSSPSGGNRSPESSVSSPEIDFVRSADMLVECPICERFFAAALVELHASTCSETDDEFIPTEPRISDTNDCSDGSKVEHSVKNDFSEIRIDSPVKSTGLKRVDHEMEGSLPCPICHGLFPATRINVHANICAEVNYSLPTVLS